MMMAAVALPFHAKADDQAAQELDAALQKLEGASCRMSEQVYGVMAQAMKGPPMITEV